MSTPSDPSQKYYFLETYGCQMNEYDSSLVSGLLEERGYRPTQDPSVADLLLVNTCSVREKAETTALDKLRSIAHHKRRRPGVRLGVLGCMAENRREAILERIPEVDLLLGPDHYDRLGEVLDRPRNASTPISALGPDRNQTYEGLFPAAGANVSAFVAIQRGCDLKCAYCIVPSTRGPERSRPSDDILREVRHLVAKGVREVTLLGQTVNAWRSDLSFADLLRRLGEVDGLRRLRFTSPHPRYFTESVCQAMAEVPSVCPHVHMPVQSGSTAVLRAMRRQYTREQYLGIVERIRRHLGGASITTDIIAGFPGETESDHQDTLSLMEAVRFDAAFMFAYSPRPGTPAAALPEDLDPSRKQERLQEIIDLQMRHTFQRLDEQVGTRTEILLEGPNRREPSQWFGKTPG
ncbi:MAG TPA: tRNA (N6-isopentenyl adenosine(37)-C2)-methylthiotransferase MiaB, partial [Fibrobacteria bacterium]|nr:tRNA (N6-isopentenyl adenosine(37)-C2)-methylthiotransferase MiaB [Fibrobacteria bacterium]